MPRLYENIFEYEMTKFQNEYRIESTRLKIWNYDTPWWYFVTINCKDQIEYFGKVINEKMCLNELGNIAERTWNDIPKHYTNVELDYYIIMPNHIHGIIIINKTVETRHASSLRKNITLSDIIGSFKSAVTKHARQNGFSSFSWQPRFYDRIIRNEKELYNIRKYIQQNPLKLDLEKDFSENIYN